MSDLARIEDEAADWLARSETPSWSDTEAAELQRWLDASPYHKAAYWRLETGWRAVDRIGALGLASASPQRPKSGWRRFTALAAGLVLIIGIGAILFGQHTANDPTSAPAMAEQRFTTPVGGHRRIGLADGSQIELNTKTQLRARVSTSSRDIWLESGEAFFEVAHREGEPFVVHAGPKTVTVLGTKFSVRREGEIVTVTVLEGRVRVADAMPSAEPRSSVISGGDVAISTAGSTLLKTRSEERIEAALAWRSGMLSFDETPLADVAREFNRYNQRPLLITDVQAREFRIGGTFQAENVEAFAKLLRDSYGLRIEVTPEAIKVGS